MARSPPRRVVSGCALRRHPASFARTGIDIEAAEQPAVIGREALNYGPDNARPASTKTTTEENNHMATDKITLRLLALEENEFAPGDVVYAELGFSVDRVTRAALTQLGSGPETETQWLTS